MVGNTISFEYFVAVMVNNLYLDYFKRIVAYLTRKMSRYAFNYIAKI